MSARSRVSRVRHGSRSEAKSSEQDASQGPLEGPDGSLTRRRLLRLAGAAVAGGALVVVAPGWVALGSVPDRSTFLIGRIVDVGTDGYALLSRPSNERHSILTTESTMITRRGRLAQRESLTQGDFRRGEEVIAFGRPASGALQADRVDHLHRVCVGSLTHVGGSRRIQVDGAELVATDRTDVQASGGEPLGLHQAIGRRVHVLAWYRPGTKDLEAGRVSVLAEG